MKKILSLILPLASIGLTASAQSVPVALTMSQHDLRGTARFMSMGGAFGALGGDLSTISQNPGGIGIYRSNEIGVSVGLDMMSSKSESGGFNTNSDLTRFNLNNIGGIFTVKIPSKVLPNVNFGFTYNKVASFNRKFNGSIPNLRTSMSNYIAGISNNYGLSVEDVETYGYYNPYDPPCGSKYVPWLSIMGYDSYLTDYDQLKDGTQWYGQYGDGTTGTGSFSVNEKGSVDEYNIALGGNISNFLYWGMDFGITSIDYRISSIWNEALENAYVYDPNQSKTVRCNSNWTMYDNYKVNGTGFNFKLGFIVKPIQELRLGIAFHTPTYYNLSETYRDSHIDFNYPFSTDYNRVDANNGQPAGNDFSFRTPWRVMASMAGVIANCLILSADYEWSSTNGMRFGDYHDYGTWDSYYGWDDDWYYGYDYGNGNKCNSSRTKSDNFDAGQTANDIANSSIKSIYKNTNTIRVGAEFRIISQLSVRAGYSWTSSPIKNEVKNYKVEVPGTGLMTNYTLGDETNYITCGVGYKKSGFYVDLAYVYKHQNSEYFPFTPDIYAPQTAVKSKVSFSSSQVALSVGLKF